MTEPPLRPPSVVMPIAALGAIKPHRLSFARLLVRRMTEDRWSITLAECDVDGDGVGQMVYLIEADGYQLYFAIRSDNVPEELRTGRLSESRFDGMGILCHGPLDWEQLDEEMQQIQRRSGGRGSHRSLGWTLCSRSSRSFDHVVDALSRGAQPSVEALIEGAPYLVRNNGYYGNGRHGTRPWASLPGDHPLAQPYFPEMFSLYMWRQYGYDLVEQMARQRSPDAVALEPGLKRYLGVGNATGQGMSTFLTKWPHWIHGWNSIRETAFARTAAIRPARDDLRRTVELLDRVRVTYELDRRGDDGVFPPSDVLAAGIATLISYLSDKSPFVWSEAIDWSETQLHDEVVNVFRGVLTEVYAEMVDDLAEGYKPLMSMPRAISPATTIAELRAELDEYDWIWPLSGEPGFHKRFFYRSEEHGEQRVGERSIDEGAQNETFTGVVELLRSLSYTARDRDERETIARFLIDAPEQRFAVERVMSLRDFPYAEVRADITASDWTPGQASRFVLATFGMEMTRAHTDRWVQGVFLQGAPLPIELADGVDRDWLYPHPPIPVPS
ncbi:MAG: hypothetical protein ACI81L_001158 [Verrucomicrobiales bacterium]|jgi:hypothetical protein